MNKIVFRSIVAIFMTCTALAAQAYAGCGALACYNNADGSVWCAAAAGYGSHEDAENVALQLCDGTPPYGGCYIRQWECNTCIYGPGNSYACN